MDFVDGFLWEPGLLREAVGVLLHPAVQQPRAVKPDQRVVRRRGRSAWCAAVGAVRAVAPRSPPVIVGRRVPLLAVGAISVGARTTTVVAAALMPAPVQTTVLVDIRSSSASWSSCDR